MKILVNMLIVSAALSTAGVSSALAQNASSQSSYQVSELQVSTVPVPSQRPASSAMVAGRDQQPFQIKDVRRTAGGIRIVGPTFFPKN